MKYYIAIIEPSAVSGVEICRGSAYIINDATSWEPLEEASIYLGIFAGTNEAEIKQRAAEYGCTHPDNIKLIDANQAPSIARY